MTGDGEGDRRMTEGDGEERRRTSDVKRDEPLGDLAADVRSRTGRDSAGDDRPPREGPLADVASEVDDRRRRRRTSDAPDPFESVEVGELDGEKLWERLAEDDDRIEISVPREEIDGDDALDGRDVRTIPKGTCHGCPHFGAPPAVACTHEGTEILEMPDADHFRVADCPMVVEEEELGALEVEADGDAE